MARKRFLLTVSIAFLALTLRADEYRHPEVNPLRTKEKAQVPN